MKRLIGYLAHYPCRTWKELKTVAMLITLLTGCNGLHRLMGQSNEDGSTSVIRILGAGQSNANNTIIWGELAAKIQDYTGLPTTFDVAAMSNTSSFDWAENKFGLLDMFRSHMKQFQPTHVFWIQGEADTSTDPNTYAQNVAKVIAIAKQEAPLASFHTAIDGWNQPDPREGQEILIAQGLAIRGLDIDQFRTPECSPPDTQHNPHFIDPCKIKIADAWFELLKSSLPKRTGRYH